MLLDGYELPDSEIEMWNAATINRFLADCKHPSEAITSADITRNFFLFWNEYNHIPAAQEYIRRRAELLGLKSLLPGN